MTTYKSKDSAMRAARKKGLKSDSVYQDETARWAIKGNEAAKPKRTGKALVKAEKANEAAVQRKLDSLAKEINVRLSKATETVEKAEVKADDQRLAAAIRLAEAKAECKSIKQAFNRWCEENISVGYTYAVALSNIGALPEGERQQALEDMRTKGREQARERRAQEKSKVTLQKPRSVIEKPAGKLEQAEAAVADLGEEGAKRFVEDQAAKVGLAVAATSGPAEPHFANLADMKRLFRSLTQADKVAFVEWACAEMEDPETVPPWLKRETANA